LKNCYKIEAPDCRADSWERSNLLVKLISVADLLTVFSAAESPEQIIDCRPLAESLACGHLRDECQLE
jgi:hypothetical protein